ncbi:MAG: YebC/PmpR family DNA-binding transcriptional regulator [Verrucomicrobia bacterium]|nr:YebC/PmpR family DNA-binding transcriptional regulator [Verrucomicrobiota bacterium]MBS0646537.1 YebC/PmpR family DNA-binding transcriptional regulator [Verrucomicrobiota bacterium]
MAGHSKWANIKHRKEKADKLKGKMFSRVAKEIISAVKIGGDDPKNNPRLRLAIQKAKTVNFPNDNIERNIKKAMSPDQADFVTQNYELYGHGGIGLIVEVMTDNKNRTASDLRIATNKRGGTLAEPGAVSYSFDRKGILQYPKSYDEPKLFEVAIEAGAEDFEVGEEEYFVTTAPTDLYQVKESLEAKGFVSTESEIQMIPQHLIACDKQTVEANQALIDWLEDLDDVSAVYHNMDLSS